eukprot:comp17423_c0_seq1/m.16808 comp17423_c0_seq1/g.16808  ORF comp17423_c0_seq1/g.16808 comp17423_c0_seq1/m.16808 type:complete len:201 (-) comp17423_c0_seq1:138-740(-)
MSMKQMENALFNLKLSAKQMQRMSVQAEKQEKLEKQKVKQAIAKGNNEGARIHAENAIRQKNQAQNYLRMSSRLDGVASRVQTAVTMGRVTASMKTVVGSMEKAMNAMNLEQISKLMDKFEECFDDLDIQTQVMEGSMQNSVTTSLPEDQVEGLMQRVADEHGLELNQQLGNLPVGATTSVTAAEQDELTERLKKLREEN